jgi:hypothetical protein
MKPPMNDAPEADEVESQDDATEDLSGMVRQVSDNLTKMQSLLDEEGVPPELTDRIGKLNEDYQALLQEILDSTKAGDEPQTKPPGGMVDANAGRGGKPLPP